MRMVQKMGMAMVMPMKIKATLNRKNASGNKGGGAAAAGGEDPIGKKQLHRAKIETIPSNEHTDGQGPSGFSICL